ncbi:MAG: hypothetical protein MRJ93_01560 [Nitrososphaeraceae archaeon]|nr:hypothetical protein [Nitrososphaeraceae archaeon]
MLGIHTYKERNMFGAENFICYLVSKYGKHPVYTDGGTWFNEACNVVGLNHYLNSSIDKYMVKRIS